jgi:hypothetical protein
VWNDIQADGTGIWTLPYVVEYSGGPAGGGVDSASRTFTIVADPPSPPPTDPPIDPPTEPPSTSRDSSGALPIALVIIALTTLVVGVQMQRSVAR